MKKSIAGGLWTVCLAMSASLAASTAIEAQQSGEIRVRVVDAFENSVEEADVRIVGLGRAMHIEGAEEARFPNVPAGDYLIEVESARAGRGLARALVVAGEITEVVVVVSFFFHGQELIVSVGAGGTRSDLYTPSHVVRGIDLKASARTSLGETLSDQPGVNSSYHGPGSSRPLIRGLGGARVRVLESGLGSGDASTTSPDHAPGVEAMAADRIEVIRGPATLIYGSSAIGGVVNIVDGRVPNELPAHPLTASMTLRGGTVADERNLAGRIDGAAGRVAVHLSGLYRNTQDYAIPGFAAIDEDHGPGAEEEEAIPGILDNSSVETSRVAGGLSYVGDNGFIGVSFLGYDSDYGVPGGHGHGEEQEPEGDVRVDLRQRRADFMAGWRLGGAFLKGIEARFGVADYQHFEVLVDEASGDRNIETRFFNNEWEGRLHAEHVLMEGSRGAVGIHAQNRNFEAIGEEAFVPPTSTFQFAAFLFEEFDLGRVGLQAGTRIETRRTEAEGVSTRRTDQGLSASLGGVFRASDVVSFVLSAARSAKLPSAEELFSNGPHLATQVFELGDPNLGTETGYSFDAGVRIDGGSVRAELSVFSNSFAGFTYQVFTGAEEDGLPVARWSQADAVFTGFEVHTELELFHYGDGHFVLDASGDYVRAELTETDRPLPRIPPLRFGAGLGYESPTWHGHMQVRRVSGQDRVAAFEEPTDGYTLVGSSLGYRIFQGRIAHDIVLSGTNLTDREARSHTSFLKELAPLPGREVRLTYQLSF
ncbi:TonB-dependent receptor [Candidatus Palauibacter sp.]|uniref:TonB-dependent receptor n=1 Tax=Candidatus Palauibacter sp. TaxID=3101350 RepID=UPI003B5BC431